MKPLTAMFVSFCLSYSSVFAASAHAEVIAEGFDQNSAEPIVIAGADTGEKVVRFLSSRFAWGGYCQSQERGIFTIIDQHGTPCVVFNSGAAIPGSYIYTRFDTTTPLPGKANRPSRHIDLSAPSARVVLTLFWSMHGIDLAVMLRDKHGWWRSSAIEIHPISWPNRLDTRYVVDPKSVAWNRLQNTTDLDEVDDGGAVALAEGEEGTPDWASIEGMGVMVARGTPEDKFYLAGMSLTDGRTPKADLREPMKNSDVAFLHLATPLEKYDEYGGVKVVYWDSGWRSNHVALTRDYGVRDVPAASMGVIPYTEVQVNPKLKAAICRDLWGGEVVAGNPSYPAGRVARMCIRQPAFLAYVKDYVKRRIYDVGAREALMDEPSGANGSKMCFRDAAACFCDDCNNAFREWLKTHYTPAQLAEMGIPDITAFDYRALLRSKVSDLKDYQRKFDQGELPFMKLFIRCQQEPARQFFCAVRDYMLSVDPAFRFTANTYNLQPHLLYLVDELNSDFHGAETELYLYNLKLLGHVLQRLKLADALGIRVVTSGVHWEFEHVRKNNLMNVFKPVIAAHYASGHQLAVPDHYRWIEPDFYGSIPDLAPYYRFVRSNAFLFDDYKPVEQVGLLMALDAAEQYTGDSQFQRDYARFGQELLDHHVPFGIAVAADGFFYKKEFTEDELASRFQLLIVPRNTALSGAQLAALSNLKTQGKVHVCDDQGLAPVLSRVKPWIACDQPDIFVLPRRKSSNPADPLIVHLINRDYRQEMDRVEEKHNITLTLHRELVAQRVAGVDCYSPDAEAASLAWEESAEGIVINVPLLKYWNILKVSLAKQESKP